MPVVSARLTSRVPTPLRLLVSGFVVVLVPVYYRHYGPTNFLYFCDVALGLAVVSLWTAHPLPASMAAVGILLPQTLWCLDFLGELVGVKLVGVTAYMLNPKTSLFLRGLSFFHFWLPFLLVYLVRRLGYDRRALAAWTALGWGLCLVSYKLLPPAGTKPENPLGLMIRNRKPACPARCTWPAGWPCWPSECTCPRTGFCASCLSRQRWQELKLGS